MNHISNNELQSCLNPSRLSTVTTGFMTSTSSFLVIDTSIRYVGEPHTLNYMRLPTDRHNRSKTYENQSTIHYDSKQETSLCFPYSLSNKISFEKYVTSRKINHVGNGRNHRRKSNTKKRPGGRKLLIFFLIGILIVSFTTI